MRKAICSLGLGLSASLIGAAAVAGVVAQKPALAVSANNGDLASYSAALPLDMSNVLGGDDALVTARVAGDTNLATYGLDFRVTERASYTQDEKRSLSFGASWNETEAALRSSMGRRMGFGLAPAANYLRLSMDMNALRSMAGGDTMGRADISSSLTLAGRQVGSLALGAGNRGEERVAVSLTRPLHIPAEFTLSTQERLDGPPDQRVVLRLLKVDW
ncbi:hypothetical protein [Caulobacter sp. NIBR2454]|uniref:hypothetical protein n=1 Tax=Caulobacter sp. NIBR2454 TaxID=3015996 RepID=UPI0022B5F3F3|nr:hypothetical protein [Caulobacter sp. NIBR2454]